MKEKGLWGDATACSSLQALSYSHPGPKPSSARTVSFTFLILVPLQNREAFCHPLHICHEDKVTVPIRQLWDQGAVCFPDKKNLHRRTQTLIYSCDRLRTVQRVGSGMRLINPSVWRKQTGLVAASRCVGSWSQVHPHSFPLSPCCRCSAGGLS